MDRSVDSIGSCSLDVEAESDISDTSGSLNFPTPISIKDITKEFTTNIRERCSIHMFNSTTIVNNTGEIKTVLAQPMTNTNDFPTLSDFDITDIDKKPSYLNLACCVGGYSNLTTYDSKIRQDINKSREVSPIRPSSSGIQYCKKNNSLAPPVLHAMPKKNQNKEKTTFEANNNDKPALGDDHLTTDEHSRMSFIQQRVERLYGPGALAQGFYSPKKNRTNQSRITKNSELEKPNLSELARKFQELSPSKDFVDFEKKLTYNTNISPPPDVEISKNNNIDLPVLRHLSQEFRAQLPTISPKKNVMRCSQVKETNGTTNGFENGCAKLFLGDIRDVVDHAPVNENEVPTVHHYLNKDSIENSSSSPEKNEISGELPCLQQENFNKDKMDRLPKDGKYFLHLLKCEQSRLLTLASEAESLIELLSNKEETTEDTLGYLRSASGKARLLVSQKMKQFEGLCNKNIQNSPDDEFPTTLDDLQGFWDMVYLQVDHIDAIFAEIDTMKRNGWKMSNPNPVNSLPIKEVTKIGKLKTKSNTSNGNNQKTGAPMSVAALKREAQRKQLLEIKRKNKIALAASKITESNNDNSTTIDLLLSEKKS